MPIGSQKEKYRTTEDGMNYEAFQKVNSLYNKILDDEIYSTVVR
jgi:hypothetical protein